MAEPEKIVVEDIILGITQEDFLENTKKHLETLYNDNSAQAKTLDEIASKAEDALTTAQQKSKSVTYDNIGDMIDDLKASDKTAFKVGDNIYIISTDVPDFWVTAVNENLDNTNDKSYFESQNYKPTQFGYYTISKLETQKVDLTNYLHSDMQMQANDIVIGNGGRNVNSSGVKISQAPLGANSTNAQVPTSKAVYDTFKYSLEKVGQIIDGRQVVAKAVNDQNGNVIDQTYATKAELENAGKVKDVQVKNPSDSGFISVVTDGTAQIDLSTFATKQEISDLGGGTLTGVDINDTPVTVENGVAKIYLEELENKYIETSLKEKTFDGVTYQVIEVDINLPSFEVFNSDNKAIVTQVRKDNDYVYYCLDVSMTGNYTLRKIKGDVVNVGSNNWNNLVNNSTKLIDGAEYEFRWLNNIIKAIVVKNESYFFPKRISINVDGISYDEIFARVEVLNDFTVSLSTTYITHNANGTITIEEDSGAVITYRRVK